MEELLKPLFPPVDSSKDAERKGLVQGCRVARGAPPVSHLFFVDDSLLFFKANLQETSVVKGCLQCCEIVVGQPINLHKSSVSFSRNTSEDVKTEVAGTMGLELADGFGKYLGLPTVVGQDKKAMFGYVEQKLRHRFGSWNKKLHTNAGKEVLLKSVV
ncbi:PREDICTED: uncharacterized protein LOC109158513 [Ipomoea nil]|uniref:uncharacterized protein LOC109158513 n=1 Tax=Ipomoea nil TaxID=35883 RepID=UPI000901FDA8|nr:PREDICTED: uncharacterized protein LOC109158513 [Ipomoea nil]